MNADATAADALELLDRHDARGVAVVDGARLVGWFSARAVLERIRREARPAVR